MKVILKADVRKLGKAGDVVDVSDGYGRNYLIPRGLAIEGTGGNLKIWRGEEAMRKAKEEAALNVALVLQKRLEGQAVRIVGRVKKGEEGGKLYGRITAEQIAEAVVAQYDDGGGEVAEVISKRGVKVDGAVKSCGEYKFTIKLYGGINAEMKLIVSGGEIARESEM